MTILLTLIIIGIIAMFHELGHFFVAKRQGIPVRELSIGIGPKIISRNRAETMFSLRLIPVFAYVRMAGATPEDQDLERGFLAASPLAKAKVLVAGSAMNVLLAILIFMILFMGFGVLSEDAQIGTVYAGSPAQNAGLEAGDVILSIDGEEIGSWNEMSLAIDGIADSATFVVERNGARESVVVTPQIDAETGRRMVGIERMRERLNPFEAIWRGLVQSLSFLYLMVRGLWMMITGSVPAEVSGPVGIANMIGEASSVGLSALLYFTAVFSLNLAVINMLPIPGLDGGKLVLVALEKVRGKRLSFEREALINLIGFALLILIMILATYKDILRLVNNG